MKKDITTIVLKGREIRPYLGDVGRLCMELFREYPYLYEGSMEFEEKYWQTYIDCPHSRAMLVCDQEKIVGVTTAIPLQYAEADMQAPFIAHHLKVNEYFYLSESLLLPPYRGQGVYRKFFEFRENAAKEQGFAKTVFIAIMREKNDPRRPPNYQSLTPIWQHFGYTAMPHLIVNFAWKEIGEKKKPKNH